VVNNSNGADAKATKLECIENGALKTFLTEWKTMYDAGALQNQSLSTNQFVAGEVAVFTGSSSSISSLLSKVGGKFEVGTSTFLRVNASAQYGATVSGSCLVMFDSDDALRKAAAWEFIKYMTGEAVQADFAIGTGYTPGFKAAVENPSYKNLLATTPQFAVAPQQLAKTPASMRSVTVGPTVDFYYAIQNEVSDMLKKGATVDATVTSMDTNLQGLLDNYLRMNP
jgi:sn-glycerol 3-phosphate transport system substrate-binding protein